MKKLLSLILMVLMTVSMMAQSWNTKSKMSSWLFNKFEKQQTEVRRNGGPLRAQGLPVRNYILTLVESTDGSATIEQKGGLVCQDFGHGYSAAFLPMDSLGSLDQCATIVRMEANEMSRVFNDNSKAVLGVDKAWGGYELPQAFRGNGVLAAVLDVGFDFTHPSFRREDGSSRVVWFWDPTAENNNPSELGVIYTSPEAVLAAGCSSDAAEQNHGSHVLGSMAGDGLEGRFAGMAPEADIIGGRIPLGEVDRAFIEKMLNYLAANLSDMRDMPPALLRAELSDVLELIMYYQIFHQASIQNKPCVLNCSFGYSFSFENENNLYEAVVNNLLGPGRIMVFAAGNDGAEHTYAKKEADEVMEQPVFFKSNDKNYMLDICTDADCSSFKMAMVIDDLPDTLFFDSFDASVASAFDQDYVISGYGLKKPEGTAGEGDDDFDTHDHPFSVYVQTMTFAGGRTGFRLQIKPADIYPNPTEFKGKILVDAPVELEFSGHLDHMGGYVKFSNERFIESRGCNIKTIAFPASLERVIAVGAMNDCSSFVNAQGKNVTNFPMRSEEGHLASFSSCGPTVDNRIKPDVVAPGHNILSVYNSFYQPLQDELPGIEYTTAYKAHVFDKDYGIWSMSGTSMSSPITAGVIALWLQANPNLTPEDIKGVIERTSHQPEPEFSGADKNVYYGWGEIDAYAGLLDILGMTGVEGLSKHQPAGLKFRVEGHVVYIDGIDGATPVTVFDLNGRPVMRSVVTNGSVLLPERATGVYAVQVGKLGSTLIRL